MLSSTKLIVPLKAEYTGRLLQTQICELLPPGQPGNLFEPDTPFTPCNALIGYPADAHKRCDNLNYVLKKRPFYDADMWNVVLDKDHQGTFLMLPVWGAVLKIKTHYQRM